jgi:hypothetical protein
VDRQLQEPGGVLDTMGLMGKATAATEISLTIISALFCIFFCELRANPRRCGDIFPFPAIFGPVACKAQDTAQQYSELLTPSCPSAAVLANAILGYSTALPPSWRHFHLLAFLTSAFASVTYLAMAINFSRQEDFGRGFFILRWLEWQVPPPPVPPLP